MYSVSRKEGCHDDQEGDEHNNQVNVIPVGGVAVLSWTRVNASVDGSSVHKNRRLAFVSKPLTASPNRDISIGSHVKTNDLRAIVREDTKSLRHPCFSGNTRVLIGCSVTAIITSPITARPRLTGIASQGFSWHEMFFNMIEFVVVFGVRGRRESGRGSHGGQKLLQLFFNYFCGLTTIQLK